jgi:hypothetical protein
MAVPWSRERRRLRYLIDAQACLGGYALAMSKAVELDLRLPVDERVSIAANHRRAAAAAQQNLDELARTYDRAYPEPFWARVLRAVTRPLSKPRTTA